MKLESTIEVGNFSIILERINAVGKLLLKLERSIDTIKDNAGTD